MLLIASGCNLLYVEPDQAPPSTNLYFYLAIDNSGSYGIEDSTGRRVRETRDVFQQAKSKTKSLLLDVTQPGDEIVGISPFTDEGLDEISDQISSPIPVDSVGSQTVRVAVEDVLGNIEVRPGVDYDTYYRNVLDHAYDTFEQVDARPEQRVFIMLTDERGTEVEGTQEVDLATYDRYYLIKLTALATGSGAIDVMANEKLALLEGAPAQAASLGPFIDAAREELGNTDVGVEPELSWMRVGMLAVVLVVLLGIVGWKVLGKPEERPDYAISVNYMYDEQVVQVRTFNFQPSRNVEDYHFDEGYQAASVQVSYNIARVTAAEALEIGPHSISVHVPESKEERSATFDIKALPPPSKYIITATKLSDISNPYSFELKGKDEEVDVLSQTRWGASLWAYRESGYLYLRARGNVRQQDGMSLIGDHTYTLSDITNRPILLDLPDEYETVEIRVRKS